MNDKITINDVEYTILVKFTSENTNKDYIIYSTLEPEDHVINIYSGILNGDTIEEVNTKEEKEIIEKMVATLSTKTSDNYNLINWE